MSWKADSLHFVAFGDALQSVDAMLPWQRAFAMAPQQLQNSPAGHAPASVANGMIGEFQFLVKAEIGRIELVVHSGNQAQGSDQSLENWPNVLDILLAHAVAFSDNIGANRVAIVGNFVRKVDTPVEAAKDVRAELNLPQMPDNSTDISFGLNVPKVLSGVNGFVNRLSRWGTGMKQVINMQFTANGIPQITNHNFNVVTLNVDVNTFNMDLKDNDLRKKIIENIGVEFRNIVGGGYDYLVR